jgi:hypothetical protein
MGIKDGDLMTWFIKKIILPRYEDYKSPGFLIVNFKTFNEVYFREVLVPEYLIADIETKFYNNDSKNKKKLQYLGAVLGFNFAKMLRVPRLGHASKEEVEKYLKFSFKFNFSSWCNNSNFVELDLDRKTISLEFKDHVICRKNGLGYILTEGAQTGFAKYVFYDDKMEVLQEKCQGRGDNICTTTWKENLKNKGSSFKIPVLNNYNLEKKFNSIKPLKYSAKSTYNMISQKIFNLNDGKIIYKNNPFFNCSVLLYYLLETELPKIRGGGKLLYDIGFKYGSKIALNQPLKFIPDFLSATGWGDILITQKSNKIQVNLFYFPWSSLIDKAKDFYLFKGMLSGMLSSTLKRKIKLKKVRKILKKDSLNLIID